MARLMSSDPVYKQKRIDSINETLDGFDPNKGKTFPYASFIPDRNPQFKTHTKRGTALSAFQYARPGILYTWEDGKWKELGRVRPEHDPERCENCDGDMVKYYTTNYGYGSTGPRRSYRSVTYLWISKPEWRQVWLCDHCAQRLKSIPTEHRHLIGK